MARIEEQAPPEQPKAPPSAPPPLRTPITVYKAKRPRKPWTFWRVLRWALLVMLLLAAAAGAAVFHYVYQPLQAVTDISDRPDLQAAQQHLIPPAPDQPKVALVIGYDRRFGDGLVGSRSDTMMLVSLDPRRHTLSLLSIPRDLRAPIPGHGYDKINAAYSIGQSALTVRTVSEYLDVDVNYIITIDFHGFRDVVDKFGGVYLPIDRRYFNQNTGGYSNFSNIDLKPGYQKVRGGAALSYVRFRHTDTDIFRLARQQTFVREFKRRIDGWSAAGNFPGLIDILRNNVKFVGATGKTPGPTTMLQYAKEIAETPRSNMFQYRIVGDGGSPTNGYVNASDTEIADTVAAFKHPDLTARDTVAKRDVGGKPVKRRRRDVQGREADPPAKLRIVTFNGSGFEGAAGGAAQGLKTAGWKRAAVGETPAISGTLPVEYQTFSSTVYFTSPRAESAAKKVQAAVGESDLEGTLPAYLKPLKTTQDVIVVVGKQFTAVAQPPKSTAPPKETPQIRRPRPRSRRPTARWSTRYGRSAPSRRRSASASSTRRSSRRARRIASRTPTTRRCATTASTTGTAWRCT